MGCHALSLADERCRRDMTLRNVENQSPIDAASQPRRTESSVRLAFNYGWVMTICKDVSIR